MRRILTMLGGGILGFAAGTVFLVPAVALALAPTVITWDASGCPAGIYAVTTMARSLARAGGNVVTSTNVRLPQGSFSQQFENLPRGQYQFSAVSRETDGRTFQSQNQNLSVDGPIEPGLRLTRSRPPNREATGVARPRRGDDDGRSAASQATRLTGSILAGLDWRRMDLLDTDDDGEVDVVRIELETGRIMTWRIAK